jgi:S-adenosylmethionine synthetase
MKQPDAAARSFFSSESVTEGHPDKVCDAVSDAILDAVLSQDPMGRVACETLVTKGRVTIAGEVTSNADIDPARIARETIAAIGYDGFDPDFAADSVEIENLLHRQSPDIADGVTQSLEARRGSVDAFDVLGAGDQGIMFGFACDETPELMPLPIQIAHRLAEQLATMRKNGVLDYLRPDGKTQVSVAYENGRAVGVSSLLISTHHAEGIELPRLGADLEEHVVSPILERYQITDEVPMLFNPSGRFVVGGPTADTGLTGRKIIVDTYGGYARHGGGAFSGKDVTKVDRSAAYGARHAAKNIVAAGLARKCELQLAYAIGQATPFSVFVETFGTAEIDPAKLTSLVAEFFDFRPAAIIERLKLRRPIFRPTAAYGHFGRSQFPWESTEAAPELAGAAGSL